MIPLKKLLIPSAIVVFGVCGYLLVPRLYFTLGVAWALHEQGRQNDAVKPQVDAVMRDIHVGDTLSHAEEVLAKAQLPYSVDRFNPRRPRLESSLRAGPYSGFSITFDLDSENKIAKFDVQQFFTGP